MKINALFALMMVVFAINANAEPVPFKQYMMCKRDPYYCGQPTAQSSYGTEAYRAPVQPVQPVQQPLYQPQYVAPAPQASYQPAPQVYQPPQQYAMRPPAPYFDTAVPQETQKQAKKKTRKTKEEAKRLPPQQPTQYVPPQPVPPVVYAPPQYTPPPPPAPEPAKADNEKILGGDITGTLGFTTDYTFRGITQTKEDPAIQGGIEYQHDVGAYIGLWASNVDFNDGDEAQVEMDFYGGYRHALTDSLSGDVGIIYYAYPGADSKLNYDYYEFYVSGEYAIPVGLDMGAGFNLEKASVGLGLNYSPQFFADSGSAYYVKATASAPFANGITLDGHVGKQWVKDNAAFALPDYMDWSVGVAYALPKQFEVKLEYIDTNVESSRCLDGCDAKAVASLSKSF